MRSPTDQTEEHLELIEELELNDPNEVARVQLRDSTALRVPLLLHLGNASQRAARPQKGETRELSREHLRMMTAAPLQVGDIYLVRFDREQLRVPDSYVLCAACRMVREGHFEAELKFFTPVDLTSLPA